MTLCLPSPEETTIKPAPRPSKNSVDFTFKATLQSIIKIIGIYTSKEHRILIGGRGNGDLTICMFGGKYKGKLNYSIKHMLAYDITALWLFLLKEQKLEAYNNPVFNNRKIPTPYGMLQL